MAKALAHPLSVDLPESWRLREQPSAPRRYEGQRATRAALFAQAKRLDTSGDVASAAVAWRDFARWCWTAGFDYAAAIQAAARSLELVFDESFSVETADRLEQLGAHLACARVLESMGPDPGPDLKRRLAGLYYRAGDAETAAAHFSDLARTCVDSTEALTRIGIMSGWAPEQVSLERGVLAWHEAARRYQQAGEQLRAFEALHRAFELDPSSALSAEYLTRELNTLGRREAADEVWRQSAVAAADSSRHDTRAVAALEAGDIVGAFAAMLDGRADVTFDMSQLLAGVEQILSPRPGLSRGFDTVLAELGCAEWLAVRLEAGPLLERWTDEADCHLALAQLEANYFGHHQASREALVRVMVVQPSQPEARARLSNFNLGWPSPDPLLRALVESARAAQGGLVARQLAGEIVERESSREDCESLQLWALERIRATGHLTMELQNELSSVRAAVAARDLELQQLFVDSSSASPEERAQALRLLERRLAIDPVRILDHLAVATALLRLEPFDEAIRSLYVELLDVAARIVVPPAHDERLSEALALAPELLGDAGYVVQAKVQLRWGQIEHAIAALMPLLEQEQTSLRGLFWLLTLVRRFRDIATSARVFERIASTFRSSVRGVLEAIAAEHFLEAHQLEEAIRLLPVVPHTSQNVPRLVTLATRLSDYAEPQAETLNVEYALSRVLPTARLYCMLSLAHRAAAEPDIALAWLQRALSLRPFDLELRTQQLNLLLEVGDVSRVADALSELLAEALPVSAWVEAAASALAWLTSMLPKQALVVAKRLLDFVGGSNRSMRAALLDAAQVNGDEAFAIEVLERACAVSTNSPSIQLALAERYQSTQRIEPALLAAWRAASAGAELDAFRSYALIGDESLGPDAELTRLELLRLVLRQDGNAEELAQTLRKLAVARQDLAVDTEGAIAIWHELAELGAGDWGGAVRDMQVVLGHRVAATRIGELAEVLSDSVTRAKALALAGQLLLELGDAESALTMLERALAAAPDSTCLLPLIERVSVLANRSEWLDAQFMTVEGSVLGVYGERSLHYRAARAFEQCDHHAAAIKHAAAAFELRPGDIATWDTLVRVSRSARQPQALAQSAMRAVESASDRASSFQWLERAYHELDDEPDELRLRFDLAIRMLVGAPQARSLRLVVDCVHCLSERGVEEIEFIRMRFERALESLVAELQGPDGARLGIAIASASLVELSRPELACRALFSALKADADLEEFSTAASAFLPRLSDAGVAIADMLRQTLDWAERPYAHLGAAARHALCWLAAALPDDAALRRLHLNAINSNAASECQRWEQEELLAAAFELDDGRLIAIAIANSWREFGHSDAALEILERAATLASSRLSSAIDQRALDAPWQAWGEAYGLTLLALRDKLGLTDLRQRLGRLQRIVPPAIVAELRVELERWSQDRRSLSSALAALAFVSSAPPAQRAQLLAEAAEIAEELSDIEAALVYYRAAFTTQSSFWPARLKLGMLMVRMTRHHTADQAQLLLEVATGLEPMVSQEQRATAVFLLAEALDVLGREQEACRILDEAECRLGPMPPIALLRAEHASRQGNTKDAISCFAAALQGDIHQLRNAAEVSVRSARAAAAGGDLELALTWLAPALIEPSVRAEALVLRAELQGADDATREAAALVAKYQQEPIEPTRELVIGIAELDDAAVSPRTADAADAPPLSEPSKDGEISAWDLVRAVESSAPAFELDEPSATGPVPMSRSEPLQSTIEPMEPTELEMAIAVGEAVKTDPEQLRAWLADGKRWLSRWPLSLPLTELVLQGVRLETHVAHEHALEHVLSVLRGETQVPRAPELIEQPMSPDAIRSLLTRELATAEAEALSLVWDGAEHEFLMEASDYEVTGVLRVSGSASPLARLYGDVSRRFGMSKTPLFYRRTSQVLETRILLLAATGALLEGELGSDEHLIAYRVGCALWATLPEHSLLFGMSTQRVMLVLSGLNLAFGASEQPSATVGEALRLAQMLWQTVRSRSQRRLRELCSETLDYERARFAANQVLRRAGLYVCGDLEVALRAAVADIGIDPSLIQDCAWTKLCELAPDLLDLFRFAGSAGYADIRWQFGRPIQTNGGARAP